MTDPQPTPEEIAKTIKSSDTPVIKTVTDLRLIEFEKRLSELEKVNAELRQANAELYAFAVAAKEPAAQPAQAPQTTTLSAAQPLGPSEAEKIAAAEKDNRIFAATLAELGRKNDSPQKDGM